MNLKILKFKVFQQSSKYFNDYQKEIFTNWCFRLFPKDSDEVIDYQGERTLEALSKFVDSNGKEAGKISEEVNFLEKKKQH